MLGNGDDEMKLTRQQAWRIVRGWHKRLVQQTGRGRKWLPVTVGRDMVDHLLFIVNNKIQNRLSYGSVKEAIRVYARKHTVFSVDDLLAYSHLPSKATRKSLVSDLSYLCRVGFLHCVTPSKRGRTGTPKVYKLADNKSTK